MLDGVASNSRRTSGPMVLVLEAPWCSKITTTPVRYGKESVQSTPCLFSRRHGSSQAAAASKGCGLSTHAQWSKGSTTTVTTTTNNDTVIIIFEVLQIVQSKSQGMCSTVAVEAPKQLQKAPGSRLMGILREKGRPVISTQNLRFTSLGTFGPSQVGER